MRRDADDFGVELVEPVGVVAVGTELLGADRRRIPRVEGKDDVAAAVLGEPEGRAAAPGQLEIGRRVSYVHLGHTASLEQLATLDRYRFDQHRLFRFFRGRPELVDPFDHVVALFDLADQGVFGGQPGIGGGDHVELAARAARRVG